MAKIKTKQKKTIQISDKDAVKLKLSKISWWECKMLQLLWKPVWQFLIRSQTYLLYDPINHRVITQEKWKLVSNKVLYTNFSLTIAKNWKQPKLPSTDKWINTLWQIHTVETYTAIKSNNTDEYQKHCVDWKKPDTREYTLYDSIYLTCRIGRAVNSRGWDGWKRWRKKDGT